MCLLLPHTWRYLWIKFNNDIVFTSRKQRRFGRDVGGILGRSEQGLQREVGHALGVEDGPIVVPEFRRLVWLACTSEVNCSPEISCPVQQACGNLVMLHYAEAAEIVSNVNLLRQ